MRSDEAPENGPTIGAAVTEGAVEVAASALGHVAAALPSGHSLILAVCDTTGRPSDLLVRDPDGRVVVLAGLAEDRRPDLGALIGLAAGELERAATEPEAPGSPARQRLIAELSGAVDRLRRAESEYAELARGTVREPAPERPPSNLGQVIARVVDSLAEEIARLEAERRMP